jgi:septum formation protein
MRLIKPLILASRSPRRIALFRQIGLEPEVAPCEIEETFDHHLSPEDNALRLSLDKARCIARHRDNALIVGADTIVTVNGTLLGKPTDAADARRMLRLLSGKTHAVHTAFAIVDRPSDLAEMGVESTRVTFRDLPDAEIEEYVRGGSPMDKAGAYGIQDDYGAVFVSRIEGCYYTVVGFPLSRFYAALSDFQNRLKGHHG